MRHTMDSPTSIARVTVLLAGEQHPNLSTQHARTTDARVVLTWDSVMLTFTSRLQVEAFREAFVDAGNAARVLPDAVDPRVVAGALDFAAMMPAVSVVFTAAPTAVICPGSAETRGGWAHPTRWVDLRLGGVMFRLLDRLASDSATSTVADLSAVARTTFCVRR
jgi:hypothetical protein